MSATRPYRTGWSARLTRRRSRRIPRPSPFALALLAGVAIILGGGYLWVRDSSLVAVKRVQIIGLSGPQVPQIRGALRSAALDMTTLDVNMGQLRTAVTPYPQVLSLRVSTQFPHGLVIHVEEHVPVATISEGGRTVQVTGAGVVVGGRVRGSLPMLPLRIAAGPTRLEQPGTLAVLRVLAAAPYALLAHIATAHDGSEHGAVVALRNGPDLYFGAPDYLAAKWAAALAVLGNSSSAGAQYIDVTDPQRPAAGATAPPASG